MADCLVHVIGAAAALTGAAVLIFFAQTRGQGALAPIAVYAAGLVLTFAASAAYNLGYDTRLRAGLRRLDHSAIFLMIAGTYTPFTTRLSGPAGLWMTAGVWSVALGGIILKLASPELFERVGVGVYLALGWVAIFVFHTISSSLSERCVVLLIAGGALYTIGVAFHLMQQLRFHNAIWHMFVLAAASCHFASVLTILASA